jgi:hypothetical protein
MHGLARELRSTLAKESVRLLAITDEAASKRPAPLKWSPKEIIGHLIDSATNNHGRFVRAQLQDDMVFETYDQDLWVDAQNYRERNWEQLVAAWQSINEHIADTIDVIPPNVLSQPRARHNLDRIAWRTVPATERVTLEYFVRDYAAHMRHHLGQIP